jgi:hypothetical protein
MGRPRAAPVVLVAFVVAVGACRDAPPPVVEDPHPAVEGRWRSDLDEVELFPGGRLLLRQGAARVLGRYEWVEADRILIGYEGVLAGAVPGDYRVGVAGNRMTLCETDVPVRCIVYERWREDAREGAGASRPDSTPPRLGLPPRADQMPREARMKEADGVLKMAYTLQQTYRAERGEYARNLYDLRDLGWETPTLRHFDAPRLVRSQGERFCITMEPRSPELWPVYIDESGEIRHGRDCH